MLAFRGVLTAVAMLWLLWFAYALTNGGALSNSLHDYARSHWIKQERQRAEDRAIREQNRKPNAAAGDPLPTDYQAPPVSGN